ncbi:DUF58 domain-containing protein [Methyloversatilis thermotolerans]|uniref:DUF58 domain-containing protein n=1 Tax=Methyloversatilis thermotolerans TaxID=1346290 RepID=UPI0003718F71|nr:VWA domain-containing protein [Methyloversatilis thermotolerans]
MTLSALAYALRWRSRAVTPGAHRGTLAGPGHDFERSVPLGDQGDARRLDLRASLRDPSERVWIRLFRQQAQVPVVVVVDVSRSMDYRGATHRHTLAVELAEAIAHSAWRVGDPFALIACDSAVRRELALPPCRSAAGARAAIARLRAHVPDGDDNSALLRVAPQLPRRRSLVFLLTDAHMPDERMSKVLASLAHHDVVTVVLGDSREQRASARWGIARLRDMESGAERLLLQRPALARAFEEARNERRERLRRIAMRYGRPPLFIDDRIDPMQFNRYFLQT